MQYSLEERGFLSMANAKSIDRIHRKSNLTLKEKFYRWSNDIIAKRLAVHSQSKKVCKHYKCKKD